MSILAEIVASKYVEVARAKERVPAAEMAARAKAVSERTRGFRAALTSHAPPAVIAELKRKSPSKLAKKRLIYVSTNPIFRRTTSAAFAQQWVLKN